VAHPAGVVDRELPAAAVRALARGGDTLGRARAAEPRLAGLHRRALGASRMGLGGPAQEVQASELELHLGLTSRQRILAEQSREFAKVVEELGQEEVMAAAAGVEISGVSAAAKQPADGADPGKGDDPNPDDGAAEDEPVDEPGAPARAGGRLRALAGAGLNGNTR